jgi:hypothetical protein
MRPVGIGNEPLRRAMLRAGRSVDVLAFAGLFLTEEHPQWLPTLRAKAEGGVRVRLLLGDPEGRQLAARDDEQAIGRGVVAGRVGAVPAAYRTLASVASIRLHDTPLYNSLYRFDDELLVNVHVYGLLARRGRAPPHRRGGGGRMGRPGRPRPLRDPPGHSAAPRPRPHVRRAVPRASEAGSLSGSFLSCCPRRALVSQRRERPRRR